MGYVLSEKTRVEVRNGFGANYVTFLRVASTQCKARWINVSKKVWIVLSGVITDVYHAASMCTDEDGVETLFNIDACTFVRVARFNDVVYVGLHVTKNNFKNIINMTEEEWLSLTVHAPNITAELMSTAKTPDVDVSKQAEPRAVKRVRGSVVRNQQRQRDVKKVKLTPRKINFDEAYRRPRDSSGVDTCGGMEECDNGVQNSIHQYRWTIQRHDGSLHASAPEWTFFEDVCETEGQTAMDLERAKGCLEFTGCDLVIVKREHILPPPMELLKMCYAYLLRNKVKSHAVQNCPGCLNDLGSQIEHMGAGGCLDSEPDRVDYYLPQLQQDVHVEQALDIVRLVYSYFKQPIEPIFVGACNLPTITSADVYTRCLLGQIDYDELFTFLQTSV